MGENGSSQMDTQATEEEEAVGVMSEKRSCEVTEYVQEWDPLEILNESTEKVTLAKTVLQKGESDVSCSREDNRNCKPNFETRIIVAVDIESPTKDKVVKESEHGSSSYAIIGEHVAHHGQLVVNRSTGPQEEAKLLGNRSEPPPRDERVEDKFVTA
jgi:hypothetical protein